MRDVTAPDRFWGGGAGGGGQRRRRPFADPRPRGVWAGPGLVCVIGGGRGAAGGHGVRGHSGGGALAPVPEEGGGREGRGLSAHDHRRHRGGGGPVDSGRSLRDGPAAPARGRPRHDALWCGRAWGLTQRGRGRGGGGASRSQRAPHMHVLWYARAATSGSSIDDGILIHQRVPPRQCSPPLARLVNTPVVQLCSAGWAPRCPYPPPIRLCLRWHLAKCGAGGAWGAEGACPRTRPGTVPPATPPSQGRGSGSAGPCRAPLCPTQCQGRGALAHAVWGGGGCGGGIVPGAQTALHTSGGDELVTTAAVPPTRPAPAPQSK